MKSTDTDSTEVEATDIHSLVSRLAGRSLLVSGPPMTGKGTFLEETARRTVGGNRDVLHIAATRGYTRIRDVLPEGATVIDCSPTVAPDRPEVTDIGSPSDLTGVSMPLSRFLEEAAPRPVVTLDSVSSILMYAEKASLFRFLSVLTAQLRRADGIGLFLLEEGCHDEKTARTFQQLFDGRVDVEPERARVRAVDGVSPGWYPR